MTRSEYRKSLFEAYNNGSISADAYDAGLMNEDSFCYDDEEEIDIIDEAEEIDEDEIIDAYIHQCNEEYEASLEEDE